MTSIYEKNLVITVKLFFIETWLKQGYDLRGYFLKITRETINFNNRRYSLFFLRNIFQNESFGGVLQRCSYNFTKFTCLWPATLLKKRLCQRCLNFVKVLRTPFLRLRFSALAHNALQLPFFFFFFFSFSAGFWTDCLEFFSKRFMINYQGSV